MKSTLNILAVAACLIAMIAAPKANALIELKGGYSLHTANPTALNDQFSGFPAIKQVQSISVDVMGNVPLMPVGLGVRYETFKRDEGADGMSSEVDWKRTSILVNKRLIDTLIYVGPIATFSVASDFKYRSVNGGTSTDYKTESQLTATAGVEAGFKLTLLRVGAEVGYMHAPVGELRNSAGVAVTDANGGKVSVDMSGPYMRATVGFGF